MSILKLENISYGYDKNKKVLKNISYEFEKGKIYAVTGKSGAGKTTLLSLLSGLTAPTEGKILFDDKDISKINKFNFRSKYVGVVFQSYNLLPQLTSKENVILSLDVSGKKIKEKEKRAKEALKEVELTEDEMNRRILKLSGGQQQRVAIARALVYEPDILLADEPTGNLDINTQNEIMNIFKKLAHDENKCVIIVTHSPEVSKVADEIYSLSPMQ